MNKSMLKKMIGALIVTLCMPIHAAYGQRLAAGETHTLAVADDGTVWAWGANSYGQLGDNTLTSRAVPAQVPGLAGVVAVAAGGGHSLALKSDGTVWAWGRNSWGQLGDGTSTMRKTPVAVGVIANVIRVEAGRYHSLAIVTGGAVWAWGQGGSGQLGQNSTSSSNNPVQIASLGSVVDVGGGENHSVAVRTDGSVWTWGANSYGQLGNGTTNASLVPVQVTSLTGVGKVAAGRNHTLAVKTDGSVMAWGSNVTGQVGDGTLTQRTAPVSVTGLTNVTKLVAGASHSLALLADGTLKAWGANNYGQLGTGGGTQTTAVAVPGLVAIQYLSAGWNHTVAASSAGVVYSWGQNNNGQLGDGGWLSEVGVPTAISDAGYVWKVVAPSFSVVPGNFSQPVNVTISTLTPGATIHYSTDGSEPTEAHPTVTTAVLLDQNTVLKAKAWVAGRPPSPTQTGTYTFLAAAPTFSPGNGTYSSSQTVTLSSTTGSSAIRYTTDGSTPTELSALYAGPITVSSPMTIKAKTFRYNWNTSGLSSAGYSFNGYLPGVPSVFPGGGLYSAPISVQLTGEPGGIVRYSLDGSDPTVTYAAPVVVDRSLVMKRRGLILQPNGTWATGSVGQESYTLKVATPTISPSSGRLSPGTPITIATTTPDALLRYRLDGAEPTETDPIVPPDGKLLVTDGTLKVRGFFGGMDPSDIVTATYTVSWNYNTGSVSGGRTHSLALTPNGVVWAWGDNSRRQLGYGEDALGVLQIADRLTPKQAGVTGVVAIAAGDDFSMALRYDRTVWTWGERTYGVLGRSTCALPSPAGSTCNRPENIGLSNVVAIAAGGQHALALSATGEVWSWGRNLYGELGDGTTTSHDVPALVPGLSGVVGISAGAGFSLALKSDGTVWAWGENSWRQLGDGTAQAYRTSPAQVLNLPAISAINAGYSHSTARTSTGEMWIWGNWIQGQLGFGDTSPTPGAVPAPHTGLGPVVSSAGGNRHTLIVKPNGELWSWGANQKGQRGDGTTNQVLSPALIELPFLARQVAAGWYHSLAIGVDGSGWAWGWNDDGEVGNATVMTDQPSPVQVFPAGTFTSPFAENARHRDLATHWSPFIYQAFENIYDVPTRFDFDGDWDGLTTRLPVPGQDRIEIYYHVQESATRVWLTYSVYHPRDTKFYDLGAPIGLTGNHQNDMEGIRVTVDKNGTEFGQIVRLETLQHTTIETTTTPEIINGSHPAVYIEAMGHGIHTGPHNDVYSGAILSFGDQVFPGNGGAGLGIWYAGRGAEWPEHGNDRDVSMELIPFEGTIWQQRGNPLTFSEVIWWNGRLIGKHFRGTDGCKANPPWSWPDGPEWFFDPAGDPTGTTYVYNPFFAPPYVEAAAITNCP